jgi:hypothetical protein
MRWRIPLVLILALFVAVSCDQQPVEPVEQPVATAPVFDFMNGPESPGVVYRYLGDLIWVDIIETTPQGEPWVVFFGTRFGEQDWVCGGPRYYQTETQQVKGEKELLKDNNYPLVAYRFAEFFPLFMEGLALEVDPYCYAGALAEQIAGGTTHVLAHGTPDLSVFRPVVNGTVTWGGETYRIHYKLQLDESGATSDGRIW